MVLGNMPPMNSMHTCGFCYSLAWTQAITVLGQDIQPLKTHLMENGRKSYLLENEAQRKKKRLKKRHKWQHELVMCQKSYIFNKVTCSASWISNGCQGLVENEWQEECQLRMRTGFTMGTSGSGSMFYFSIWFVIDSTYHS